MGGLRSSWKRLNREILSLVLLAVGILAVKSSIAETYMVPTGSMVPTILPGDRLVADQTRYGLRVPFLHRHLTSVSAPSRGDIVIFPSPISDVNLIKRVIAVEGDTIEIRNGRIILNGKMLPLTPVGRTEEGFEVYHENLMGYQHRIQFDPDLPNLRSFSKTMIKRGEFFVMGDNRDYSADSRVFGPVSIDQLRGKALKIIYSLKNNDFPYLRTDRLIEDLI
jgi:signal peptidase I